MGRQSLGVKMANAEQRLSPCSVQQHKHRSEKQVFPDTALLGPGLQRLPLPGALLPATTRRRRPLMATLSAHASSGALIGVARWQSKNGGGGAGGGCWSEAQDSQLRPPQHDPQPLQPAGFSKRAHRQQAPCRAAGRRPAPHRRTAQASESREPARPAPSARDLSQCAGLAVPMASQPIGAVPGRGAARTFTWRA